MPHSGVAVSLWLAELSHLSITKGTNTMDLTPTTLLETEEAAAYLSLTPGSLRTYQSGGKGPMSIRRRGRRLYSVAALDLWIRANRGPVSN